uniref:tRNA-uridine aminocarboxypropyltransferase n=1 Tax=Corethron hystrix TaxID=216773 RepID=A0A7S1FNY9_9STRA|mmetsp:Transcript_19475/g.44351  ORF Transcript_19475/g.44351 Transcript_19475/m.44351 type:complete len:530 (+) Transcript_19475:202-1791(+)
MRIQGIKFRLCPLFSIISIVLFLSITVANLRVTHALLLSNQRRSPKWVKLNVKQSMKHTPQIEIPTIVKASAISRATLSRSLENNEYRQYCPGCHRPPIQCLCDYIPPNKIPIAIKVLILQHPVEFRRKTISTVPLIRLTLEYVQVLVGRSFDHQLDSIFQAALSEGTVPLLLFPGPNSTTLEDPMALTKLNQKRKKQVKENGVELSSHRNRDENKFLLVIVDGTWTQARKMVRCSPILMERCQQIQFTSTSIKDRSIYGSIRKQPDDYCLSTLESCSRTLKLLEPNNPIIDEVTEYLHNLLRALVHTQIEQERISLAKHSHIRNLEKIKLKQKRQLELGFDSDLLRSKNKARKNKEHLKYEENNTKQLGVTDNGIKIDLGDGLLLRNLIPSDSVFVDLRWPYRSNKSLKMIEKQIIADNINATRTGCHCCLGIEHDNQLVACIIRHRNGALGMFHVDEAYRRRGLGKVLLSKATASVQQQGDLPIAFILDGNTPSEKLFSMLGWCKENPLTKKGTGKRKAIRKWILKD